MASSVSKLLPDVLKVQSPALGAVQVNQTDLPPALPAWAGSPASLVAVRLSELTVPELPVIARALAKLSLLTPLVSVKLEALVAVPPGDLTVSGPVVAPEGTVAVIWLDELTVNAALTPLNNTFVAPVKLAPVMVTPAPTAALEGENPEIAGAVAEAAQLRATVPEAAGLPLSDPVESRPPRCGRPCPLRRPTTACYWSRRGR